MQHFLKAPPGTAGTQIIATQLFDEVLLTVNDPVPFLDLAF
jgi:hypothetical protein